MNDVIVRTGCDSGTSENVKLLTVTTVADVVLIKEELSTTGASMVDMIPRQGAAD